MKYILLFSLLFTLSCHQTKNVKKETEKIKTEIKEKEKTQEELVVVLKNPKNVVDAKALIENSSLIWSELVIDNTTLKAALIKVPVAKTTFWIDRLQKSNTFSSVEVKTSNSINVIKDISENTFLKIRKTHCSGHCTVYDATLLKDGRVIFNGIENVLIKGKQEFTISKTRMKKLQETFSKTSFGKYFDSYIDKSLMDYPSTFITHDNKEIEIKLWKYVPLELVLAYEDFENVLFEKKMIE